MNETTKVGFLAVLVTGGRGFDKPRDKAIVFQTLDRINSLHEISLIIHGGCVDRNKQPCGADHMAHLWAIANEVPVSMWPAKWVKHGTSAGPRRNVLLANALANTPGAKICVAFPGGRGTADMTDKAARLVQQGIGVDILQVQPESEDENTSTP